MTEQTPKPNIQLVIIDVDNTLLTSEHKLSERNERAIKAAIEKGVKIMLATGKNFAACKSLIDQLGITEPGIYTQGLTINNADGSVRHQQTLDANIARQVITFAEDRGFAVVVYANGGLLARSSNPYIEEMHTKWGEVKPQYVGPLQNILHSTPVNKVQVLSAHDARKIKALRWQLSAQLNGSARLVSGGVDYMLEIVPPGGSKGKALRALLKEMKIDPRHVIAIGDAENDVEMIQAAGIGVAVENGQQVIKDAADEVTASNDEDGVALILEKYILGETVEAENAPEAEPATKPEDDEQSTAAADPIEETAATAPKPEDAPAAETDTNANTDTDTAAMPKPEDMSPESKS